MDRLIRIEPGGPVTKQLIFPDAEDAFMTVFIVLACIVVFCAMILNLAAKPKLTRGLVGAFMLIAGIGGLIMYGIGFDAVLTDPLLIIVRTVLAVSRMYAGVNDFSAISSAPLYSHTWAVVIFWVFHLMAFYATASATISVLGSAALKRIKYWMQRYGASVIVFGISNDTVELGRSLTSAGVKNIVFVAGKPDSACESAINTMGCLVRTDVSALEPDLKFLKSLGSEKGAPELKLYALDADETKNRNYAEKLLAALEKEGVDTANVSLVMRSTDESVECGLSRTPSHYGYGDVRNFTDVSVAGRMLMQLMPPCNKMDFLPDGRAAGDFDAVVVGFGKTGRSVLRNLVRNAQFEGSHFRTAVFSPAATHENGYFCSGFPGLVEEYDISFIPDNAGSISFFNYLREHASTLRYIVVCTGKPDRDVEICTEISSYLIQLGCRAAVCRCSSRDVAWSVTPEAPVQFRSVYGSDAIISDVPDRMAVMLNYSYVNDPDITPEAAWSACDYFSRESSRAAADFCKAYIRMLGRDEDSVTAEGWGELSDKQKENLGRTEHLRWNAFHYSMGFTSMSDETLIRRGEQRLKEEKETGSSRMNIAKDLAGRQHACLRTWEELDAAAELESRYTGVCKDYKDMDIRNVLAIPAVLRAAKEKNR